MKTDANFDGAVSRLSFDLEDKTLTANQLVHTAECLGLAYGPQPRDILNLAIMEGLMRHTTKKLIPPYGRPTP